MGGGGGGTPIGNGGHIGTLGVGGGAAGGKSDFTGVLDDISPPDETEK